MERTRSYGILEQVSSKQLLDKQQQHVFRLFLKANGEFPNNAKHPVLLFRKAFQGGMSDGQRVITREKKWTAPWAWGIFPYHHYHSMAWELWQCLRDTARVQMGGESGPLVDIARGDLVLIPPGVAHKQLEPLGGFTLLGAYPTDGCTGPVVDTLLGRPTKAEMSTLQPVFHHQRNLFLEYNFRSFINVLTPTVIALKFLLLETHTEGPMSIAPVSVSFGLWKSPTLEFVWVETQKGETCWITTVVSTT